MQSYKKNLTYASKSQEKFYFSSFISKSVCQRSIFCLAAMRERGRTYFIDLLLVAISSRLVHKKVRFNEAEKGQNFEHKMFDYSEIIAIC